MHAKISADLGQTDDDPSGGHDETCVAVDFDLREELGEEALDKHCIIHAFMFVSSATSTERRAMTPPMAVPPTRLAPFTKDPPKVGRRQ